MLQFADGDNAKSIELNEDQNTTYMRRSRVVKSVLGHSDHLKLRNG